MSDEMQGEYLPILPLSSPRVPVHLCILAGADNRAGVVGDTVRVCERYFHQIHILDTGSTDATEAVCDFSPKVRYRRFNEYWGDNRAAYAETVRDVPVWEWFLMLDSDERPSQHFLDHISAIIDEATSRRINCWHFSCFMHLWRNGKMDYREPNSEPSSGYGGLAQPAGTGNYAGFQIYRFWQKHPELCAVGWGSHGGFRMKNADVYVPKKLPTEYYFIHCKTWDERQLGTFVFSWVWPESHSIPANTRQHRELIELKNELHLNDCNTLSNMIYNRTLPQQVIDLMNEWETRRGQSDREQEELRVPHLMAAFIRDYYLQDRPIEKYGQCGLACCRYKNLQL